MKPNNLRTALFFYPSRDPDVVSTPSGSGLRPLDRQLIPVGETESLGLVCPRFIIYYIAPIRKPLSGSKLRLHPGLFQAAQGRGEQRQHGNKIGSKRAVSSTGLTYCGHKNA